MSHAGGLEDRYTYPVQISFPGTPLPSIHLPTAASANLIRPNQGQAHIALLGRDLLSKLRFVYNGPMGRIELAF